MFRNADLVLYCLLVSSVVVAGIYFSYRGFQLEKQRQEIFRLLDKLQKK